jgi:hypothetical protein
MTIEELNELDLSYTPPLSSPWDPVQMSAQAWLRENMNVRNKNADYMREGRREEPDARGVGAPQC